MTASESFGIRIGNIFCLGGIFVTTFWQTWKCRRKGREVSVDGVFAHSWAITFVGEQAVNKNYDLRAADYCVGLSATVREAVARMDKTRVGIALVVDEK